MNENMGYKLNFCMGMSKPYPFVCPSFCTAVGLALTFLLSVLSSLPKILL